MSEPVGGELREKLARVLSQAWSEQIGEPDDPGADSYHFSQADAVLASGLVVATTDRDEWRDACIQLRVRNELREDLSRG